jgi:hypothetical protein
MNTEIGGRSASSDVTDHPQVPKLPSMNSPKQEINTDR